MTVRWQVVCVCVLVYVFLGWSCGGVGWRGVWITVSIHVTDLLCLVWRLARGCFWVWVFFVVGGTLCFA